MKSTVMVSQKENLARAGTSVKDMVAFMRAFKGGKQVVSAIPGGMPAETQAPLAVASGPAVPAPAVPPAPASAGGSVPPSLAMTTTSASVAGSAPAPAGRAAMSAGLPSAAPAASLLTAAPGATAPAQAPRMAAAGTTLPSALPSSANAAAVAAQAERLRLASMTFNTLCIACHGADGRGTAVRTAMPQLPNFTLHDWHTTKSTSQLATTIMEGKGLMPAWNAQLTADKARDLALYVRSFGAPEMLAETQAASAPSMAAFDSEMQSLRQSFDEIEKQLQALSAGAARP